MLLRIQRPWWPAYSVSSGALLEVQTLKALRARRCDLELNARPSMLDMDEVLNTWTLAQVKALLARTRL